MSRRDLLAILDSELERQKAKRAGKLARFGGPAPAAPELPDDPRLMLRDEYEHTGYYISGHPLDYVRMTGFPNVTETVTITKERAGETVELLGIVEDPSKKTTRKTKMAMAFFGLSDRAGYVNCLTFGEDNCKLLNGGIVVHVRGAVESRDDDLMVKVSKVKDVIW